MLISAAGLRDLGIGKGDAVGVHLPMMPETVAVMLAVARVGAVAVPLFTGYGAAAIAERLIDVGAKVVFTANAFPRRGRPRRGCRRRDGPRVRSRGRSW